MLNKVAIALLYYRQYAQYGPKFSMYTVNRASMQNESPTLKLFYYHHQPQKLLVYLASHYYTYYCIYHPYMTLYNHNTVVQKLFELVVIDRMTLFSLELLMKLKQHVITMNPLNPISIHTWNNSILIAIFTGEAVNVIEMRT